MIKTIEKPCPGDCSICTYPNEIPGFDMYGCVLNQTIHRTIRMEQQIQELSNAVYNRELSNDKVIIKHTEGMNDDASNEKLPEQDGQE